LVDSREEALNLPHNVHFLRRDWFNANSILITGSPTVLIDCGSDTGGADLLRLLEGCGASPQSIDLIVASHAHADHVGMVAEFQQRCSTRVAMHEYDAYYVNRDDQWATWRLPHGNHFPPFHVDIALRDGEVLELDGLSLHVLHTPGHAHGGISLYCPEHRFLLSGDAVWERAVGVIDVVVEGSIAPFLARESVRKLMALDLDVIIPGHGRAITDPTQNLEAALRYVEDFLADPARMAYDLVWRVLYYNLCDGGDVQYRVLLDRLSSLPYFADTNRLRFKVSDAALLDRILLDLQARGLVRVEDGLVRAIRRR
jgi:glyoxylase-like metal-dependent hydrolase (beta-lactamase superfamily II)